METTVKINRTPLWLNIIRIIVGFLFIFSGLIKANDPMGLSFKMQEFFHNWGLPSSFDDFTLVLSIVVITFEIVAGVALLLGYAFRTFSFLLLLLIIFFTFLTGYAVWYNIANGRELKCGCFGDCIPLTANQSFAKDIILFILIIILLIYRDKIKPVFASRTNTIILVIAFLLTLGIQWYVLKNLPFIDCLPYKIGNNINDGRNTTPAEVSDPTLNTISYKITRNGVEKIYTYDEFMADSTLWEEENIVEVPNTSVATSSPVNTENLLSEFSIMDENGEDFTEVLLSDTGYYFLWIIKDPNTFNKSNLQNIKNIYQETLKGETVGLLVLTSGTVEDTKKMLVENGLGDLQVLLLDGTTSKTMMRSNPGLMLLQNGEVQGKWSYANYPNGYKLNGNKIQLQ